MVRPPDEISINVSVSWNRKDHPDELDEVTVTAPNGQWWRVTGKGLAAGVYINGDPWVQTSSTVEVVELSHMPTGAGASARHGGMINPSFNETEEGAPLGRMITSMKQGYDGRAVQDSNVMDYDEEYNAHAPLLSGGTIALAPGDSLVSAESWQPELATITNNNSCVIARMACLTIVDTAPEPDEFRSNYFGSKKIRKRFSDADLSLLPEITAPFNPKGPTFEGFHIDEGSIYAGADPGDPHPTQAQQMEIAAVRHLQYWVHPLGGNSSVPLLKPVFQQSWYPRDSGTAYGQLAMYVMCDFEDRDKHLVSLIQLAIDAYAVAEGDGFVGSAPFAMGAGYFASPLWPIRLAGLLFGEAAMLDAVNIPTGHTDIYGNTYPKWGELVRVYYSTTAHAQYLLPEGYSNPLGVPLYGDLPTQSAELGQSSNGTIRDPKGIYDAHDYKYGLPTADYPNIMADAYELMLYDGIECQTLGAYMPMSSAMMGSVLSSFAMDDQDFWGGAVVDFALRTANDPQMWIGWGYSFDYSDAFANTFQRDIRGHGGNGNGWMCAMWDSIVPGSPA